METGSSNNSCSNTFAGSAPFSEPESLAVANFLTKNVAQIKVGPCNPIKLFKKY